MKKILVFLPLLLFIVVSSAQEDRKGHLGISIGPSIPLGDYADNDIGNADAGYADIGLHLNFNFYYKLDEKIGISALWSGTANPIDVNEKVKTTVSVEPDAGRTLEADPWVYDAVMVGPFYSFSNEKVEMDLRGLIGFSFSTIPQNEIVLFEGGIATKNYKQNEADATSFAYNLGIGLRYLASEKIVVTTNLDYFSTQAEFNVATTSNFGLSSNNKVEQSIKALNVTFGIGYRLK